MRGTKKANCTATSEKKVDSEVKNCFLFDEEGTPKSGDNANNSSSVTQKSKTTEFYTDKPYRLSLYMHPSTRRQVDRVDSRVLANLTQMRLNRDKENINKCKRGRTKVSKENINVTLFEEENDTEKYEKKIRKLEEETLTDEETPSKISKKSILSYMNVNESVTKRKENEENELSPVKTKQKKVQKAYIKKSRDPTNSKNIIELPSETIEKERETKTNTKVSTKPKGRKEETKEKDEFEKWAESINSDFDEIDKFELSITYD